MGFQVNLLFYLKVKGPVGHKDKSAFHVFLCYAANYDNLSFYMHFFLQGMNSAFITLRA